MLHTSLRRVAVMAIVVGLCGVLALAQSQSGADQLMQQARTKAVVEGKLDEAVKLYADIATKFADDRATVVRALIEMADCYQKLGRPRRAKSTNGSSASMATRRRWRPRPAPSWRRSRGPPARRAVRR